MTKPFIIAFAIHTAVVTSVGVSGAHAQAVNLTPEQIDMVRDCRAQGNPTRTCIEQAQEHTTSMVMQRLRAVQGDTAYLEAHPAAPVVLAPVATPEPPPPHEMTNAEKNRAATLCYHANEVAAEAVHARLMKACDSIHETPESLRLKLLGTQLRFLDLNLRASSVHSDF